MSLSATIDAMMAAGCSKEQIAIAVKKLDEDRRQKAREGNRVRQARFRDARNASNGVTGRDEALCGVICRDEALVAVTERDPSPVSRAFSIGEEVSIYTPVEPTVLTPKPEKQTSNRQPKALPAAELVGVLGDDLAAEVVDHRRRLRRPMTPQSAARLATQFAQTGRPQDAARMMIDRGWQGFKADWFENADANLARAGPSSPMSAQSRNHGAQDVQTSRSASAAANALKERLRLANSSKNGGNPELPA